jgi:hypothetical protein
MCVRQLDDLPGAVADFTAAAALDPRNADFYHNRGFSLRKLVSGYEQAELQHVRATPCRALNGASLMCLR